jgi:YHS domain-containing protein
VRSAPPPWNQTAARARWLVYHSLWASVGTVSVHLNGLPWGNVRSVADGNGANSTGLPYLYVPTPDPTAADLAKDANVTISFSEASLAERVTAAGLTCGGMDAEDPTCARLHIGGRLRALSSKAEIGKAEDALGKRHPYAPWLAQGGAHTGGRYYTIEPTWLAFLDFYGGPPKLSVAEYLAAPPPKEANEAETTASVGPVAPADNTQWSMGMGPPHGSNTSFRCPVTGEAGNISASTPSIALLKGQKLYFSSEGAVAKYRNSPRDYWLAPHDLPEPGMDGMRGLPDFRGQMLACPRSGMGLNVSMQTPRVMQKYGQAVYFCCHGCVTAFWRDPASLFANLSAGPAA